MNMRGTVLRRLAINCLILAMVAAMALPAAARTRPHYGGSLRVEVEDDPWQRPGGLARSLVLEGLTATGVDGRVRPALAVEWKSDNGDHRWQFRLRAGVHFHDGTALNAANVVTALTEICGAGCPWTSVRAVGAAVVFLSETPQPNLPDVLASDDYRIALRAENAAQANRVGTGPFAFVNASNGVQSLRANDNCWQGRPFVDAVEIRGRRPIRDQWLDLSLGRADLVEVPAELLRQANEQRLNLLVSQPDALLALTANDTGALADASLRAAIAMAVDRSALFNVIFQKQGEITASLLPAEMTGYSFLFPTDRDLNKAVELRGGASVTALSLAAEGGGAVQLAAQRLALNLRDAGFVVHEAQSGASKRADLTLREIPLDDSEPRAALASVLRGAGMELPVEETTLEGLYKVEHQILETHAVIPLLYLPRAYALSGRVRNLRLGFDGTPLLADASLEDSR
jgi:peptide/nickel transport system substrate-binding protein